MGGPRLRHRAENLSDAFLKLISMIVGPIVFCVVVHGIAGAGDLKKVGRVGVKALIYFEVMTTVALVVGILLAFLFGPGHGMNIDPSTLDAKAMNTYADNAHKLQGGGIGSFLLNIIPLDLVRRAVAQRRAAGAVLCDPVRHWSCAGRRRKGRED
jgi:aerobic C4-dicarboxylate transport protein